MEATGLYGLIFHTLPNHYTHTFDFTHTFVLLLIILAHYVIPHMYIL